MTSLNYPRNYAGDTNYTSGVDTGTPTKVDPGSAAELQGLIPGVAVAAPVVNYTLNTHAQTARYCAEQALQSLAPLRPAFESAYTDTVWDGTGSVFSLGSGFSNRAPYILKGGTPAVWQDQFGLLDPFSSSMALADPHAAARPLPSGSVVVAVGAGSSGISVSSDFGSTWSAVAAASALTATKRDVGVVDEVAVIAGLSGSVLTLASPFTTTATAALSAAHLSSAVAARSASHGLVLRTNAGVATGTDETTDGLVYADAGGSFLNTPVSAGDIATDGTFYYWAGKIATNVTSVQVSADDGANWTQVATVSGVTPQSSTYSHELVCVPGTTVMWMAVRDSSETWWLFASADSGLTWFGPRKIATLSSGQLVTLSVADGYLYVGVPGRPMLRTFWRLA